jgi:pimeloyl-ACP methyl ester carboxylesterase
VVALGAVSCLADGQQRRLGNGATDALMGGGPETFQDRYRCADPVALLPLGCPLQLVHGALDDVVPPDLSRAFAARARAVGDQVTLAELRGISHMDVVDPLSPAWPAVLAAFTVLAPPVSPAAG